MNKFLSSIIFCFLALYASLFAEGETYIQGKEAIVFTDLYDKMVLLFDGQFIMIDEWHSIDGVPNFQCSLVDIELLRPYQVPCK